MIQTFEIEGKLPGLNDHIKALNSNRFEGGKFKRKHQDIVCWAIRAAHLKPQKEPCDIRIHWIEPNMRRDKDNIRFATKYIFDALVEMGILKNDGWKNIHNISDRFSVNSHHPRIVVTLESLEER